LNTDRILVKINRICAWMLLIFMIIFLVSGYAWWNRTIMSLSLARYMHTQLDLFLVFFFLVHALISIRLTLARWRVGHGRVVSTLLAAIGMISFWLVLSIR
jgi:hypothetical protein